MDFICAFALLTQTQAVRQSRWVMSGWGQFGSVHRGERRRSAISVRPDSTTCQRSPAWKQQLELFAFGGASLFFSPSKDASMHLTCACARRSQLSSELSLCSHGMTSRALTRHSWPPDRAVVIQRFLDVAACNSLTFYRDLLQSTRAVGKETCMACFEMQGVWDVTCLVQTNGKVNSPPNSPVSFHRCSSWD